jgi:hypothetical protein
MCPAGGGKLNASDFSVHGRFVSRERFEGGEAGRNYWTSGRLREQERTIDGMLSTEPGDWGLDNAPHSRPQKRRSLHS